MGRQTPSAKSKDVASVASALQQTVQSIQQFAASKQNTYTRYQKPKSGGGQRLISQPTPELMELQQRILQVVLHKPANQRDLQRVVLRDPLSNARAHPGKRWVVALDIKDAFPSTSAKQIVEALRRNGFSIAAASLLARVCTDERRLPQGAPTSNALLDIVLAEFDRTVIARGKRQGIGYTRYVDNITVSGPVPVSAVEAFIVRKLRTLGYSVNDTKTQRGGQKTPVEITGIDTGKTMKVKEATLSRTRDRLRLAAYTPGSEAPSSAQGGILWVRRVNPRQAASLIQHNVPVETPLAHSLQRKGKHSRGRIDR